MGMEMEMGMGMGMGIGMGRHPKKWLFLSAVSKSNWNLNCWFSWKKEN